MSRRHAPSHWKPAYDRYLAGMPVFNIAQELNLSEPTIHRHVDLYCDAIGIARPRRQAQENHGTWTPELMKQCIQLYAEGMSLSEIAKRVGWSNTAIRERLLKEGVELRPRGRRWAFD